MASYFGAPSARLLLTLLYGLTIACVVHEGASAADTAAGDGKAPYRLPGDAVKSVPGAKEAADAFSAYFNGLTGIKADFVQIDDQGAREKGVFYLERPRKFRWEYAPPSPLTLILNGAGLAVIDRELEEIRQAPADDSLVSALAGPAINLAGDPTVEITDFSEEKSFRRLTLRKRKAPEDGALTLIFTGTQELKLEGFIQQDSAGRVTQILFTKLEKNPVIPKEMFFLPDVKKPKR